MKIVECRQGEPQWLEARRGIASASNFGRIITSKTGKMSAQADDYACELIAERYYMGDMDALSSPASVAMRNGTIMEPSARRWYEFEVGEKVDQVGFILSDDGRFGCSPDALVGADGGLELKCPMGKTHVRYLLDGTLPDEYRAQVHGALVVTGRKWWDFMSYAEGLPAFRVRVQPDEFTDQLRDALAKFAERHDAILASLNLPALEREVITDADHPF